MTRRLGRLAVLCLILVASICGAAAETGTVVRVVDGDTIWVRVDSQERKVRLLGIDTPEPDHGDGAAEAGADQATAFTRALAQGKTVVLETDPEADAEDQYDRALRYVFLPDGRLLNAAIVAEGYAEAYTRFPCSRLPELRQLEREARESGRGMWKRDDIPRMAAAEAGSAVGTVATVCGVVASAKYAEGSAGRPTFLNLDKPHPDQSLAIVIWGTVREAFDEPETRYAKRSVCVTGRIRSYRGNPEIVVSDPSRIEMID